MKRADFDRLLRPKVVADYEDHPAIGAAKRLGIRWTPAMGDWFTSWSPRASSSTGEGPWEHWIELALAILQHPFTRIVRPDVAGVVQRYPAELERRHPYDETHRSLTTDELAEMFVDPEPLAQPAELVAHNGRYTVKVTCNCAKAHRGHASNCDVSKAVYGVSAIYYEIPANPDRGGE